MKNWIFVVIVVCFALLGQACVLDIPPWEELSRDQTVDIYICGDPGKAFGTYLDGEAFAYQVKLALKDIDANVRNRKGQQPLFRLAGILPDAFYGTKESKQVKGRCVFWIPTDKEYPTQAGRDMFAYKMAKLGGERTLGYYNAEGDKNIFIFFPIAPSCPVGSSCAWTYFGSAVADVVGHELCHTGGAVHLDEDFSGFPPDTPGLMSLSHHTLLMTAADVRDLCDNGSTSCDPNFPGTSARLVSAEPQQEFGTAIDQ
ncbi:MAG TPA: hypothetical protein VLK22_01525 [Candidatus Udaeobacter sp.]|nr:hypothetical protein [Candidatus Udaeobacter sp.]